MSEVTKQRPKFLALHEIKLPLAGFASILHRVSGAGMFLMLPLLIYILQLSLDSNPASAAQLNAIVCNPLVLLILFGLVWAFFHHFCMGIRILLIDIHVGVEKEQAQASAKMVMIASLALTAVFGLKLFGCY